MRVHGTGRVTLRNRRFLRKFSPTAQPTVEHVSQFNIPVTNNQNDNSLTNQINDQEYPAQEEPPQTADMCHDDNYTQEENPKRGRGRPRKEKSNAPCHLIIEQEQDYDVQLQEPRRSTRDHMQRKVYNDSTGKDNLPHQ